MNKRKRQEYYLIRWAILTLSLRFLVLTVAQAAAASKGQAPKYIFYPPPPEKPRLQFLVKFSEEQDLGQSMSKLSVFVTGAKPTSKPILKPYGVALSGNQIFVCDTTARALDILNLTNKTMRFFAPAGMGKMGSPISLAIDADGTRYVADTLRNQVLIYGSDDTYRGALGASASLRPTGVALAGDRVYVADVKGHCIRVYGKTEHQLLFTIPRDPDAAEDKEPGKLYIPANLTLDSRGQVYVSDTATCRVKVYDPEGRHLRTLGTRGDLPGQFARPKGLAVDREGRIFVVDAATEVCQIFDAEGNLLLFFGEPEGSAAPLNLPAGVTVDYEHVASFRKYAAPDFVVDELVIISNQLGDKKISVYGLGHRK
jgi:DNA-binding beta-propeller fold protein YncE